MDIERLVRDYVFLNDPKVRQVTTRFMALVIAVAAVAGVYILMAGGGLEETGTTGDANTAAESPTNDERAACMRASEVAGWVEANPDAVIIEREARPDGSVCITYVVRPPVF